MSTKGADDFATKQEQYRAYTIEQLHYASRDAAAARDAMRGHDAAAENWYADDVHTIGQEIASRKVAA